MAKVNYTEEQITQCEQATGFSFRPVLAANQCDSVVELINRSRSRAKNKNKKANQQHWKRRQAGKLRAEKAKKEK